MSLFSGLYVGASGLQTSQNALNTVAHNMTNVDTEGYTRQQVSQSDRTYNTLSTTASAVSYQQVGLGVSYSQVKQVRDVFLDKSYRRESGREGFYEVSCDAIEEVENIFQELDGEAFATTLDNLWESVQELAKDPSNTVNQGIFIQRCSEFVVRAQAVYDNLTAYQDDLNYDVKQKVDTINSLGDQIVELNTQILKIESGQVEKANDLRDQRNQLIDELSSYVNIKTDTDVEGNVLIQIEGIDFVSAGDCHKMDVYTDPVTGFYTPFWRSLATYTGDSSMDISERTVIPETVAGARVFNISQEISTDMNTDIGSLKSTLLARGDRRATYEDLEEPYYSSYSTSSDPHDDTKDSIVMNVMAEFDQLVHDITTEINQVFIDAANTAQTLSPGTNYLIDETTGEPYKIFEVYSTEDSESSGDWTDDYHTSNILINESLKQSPSLLGLIRDDGIVDQDCADALKEVFTAETHTLNPNVKTSTNLTDYYNNLISQVSNTGYVMRGISANQTITVTNIRSAREEILGVSSDEELSNMIMYQNAFNASSRFINAVSEMIEHLISTLGS